MITHTILWEDECGGTRSRDLDLPSPPERPLCSADGGGVTDYNFSPFLPLPLQFTSMTLFLHTAFLFFMTVWLKASWWVHAV